MEVLELQTTKNVSSLSPAIFQSYWYRFPCIVIRSYWNTKDFVYGLEWDTNSIYTWYTSRAREIFRHDFVSKNFWDLGGYNAAYINPWDVSNHTNATPFDQNFYVSISVGVAGTTGVSKAFVAYNDVLSLTYFQFFDLQYFADSLNKPYGNNALNAAGDFWNAREKC